MPQYYISELYDFFEQLRANNNRPWFAAHKSQYQELRQAWLAAVDRMIAAMAQWEPALSHL